jgi:predicted MFS family arabinose efflux permease
MIFVSLVVGRLVSAGNLWGALLALMAVLLVCMLVSMLVPEQPQPKVASAWHWEPVVRLALMTGAFALTILGAGAIVKLLLSRLTELPARMIPLLIAIAGVLSMGGPIVLGVWVSVRIGIGHEIAQNPSFVWWVINRLAFLVAANSMSGFMLYYLQERYALLTGAKAAGPATMAMMLVGICILLVAVPSGWLADRVDKKLLATMGGLFSTAGMGVVLLVPSLIALNLGGALIGVGVGLFFSASWALGTALVPQAQAGRYLGLANLAGAGAGAIGAYIGGPIADHSNYVLLFAIYGLLFLLSVLALAGIRQDRSL